MTDSMKRGLKVKYSISSITYFKFLDEKRIERKDNANDVKQQGIGDSMKRGLKVDNQRNIVTTDQQIHSMKRGLKVGFRAGCPQYHLHKLDEKRIERRLLRLSVDLFEKF